LRTRRAGWPYIRANKLQWKLIEKHPGTGIKNRFGIPDCPERVHWEEAFAHEVGAPGAYDYGPGTYVVDDSSSDELGGR